MSNRLSYKSRTAPKVQRPGDEENAEKNTQDPTKEALNVGRYNELMELAKKRYETGEEEEEPDALQPSEEGYEKAKAQVRAKV